MAWWQLMLFLILLDLVALSTIVVADVNAYLLVADVFLGVHPFDYVHVALRSRMARRLNAEAKE